MAKTLNFVKLILIIVCVLLVLNLKSDNSEGFFAGLLPNRYMYSFQNGGQNGGQNGLEGPNGTCGGGYNLNSQPLLYPAQMYPKIPWYPKTGDSCVEGQCGATSTCVDGTCRQNLNNNTVFGVPIQ